MHQDVVKAIEQGATVIAASKRLARVLTESFTAQQRTQGKSVWTTPDILPWGGLLNRLWRNWLLEGDSDGPMLLNPIQELAIWESVVRGSKEGRELLQIPETARKALEAWALLRSYRLPLQAGQFLVSEDSAAFSLWAKEFERRVDENGWIEQARLADVLADLFRKAKLRMPQTIYLAGFDEFTPQQKALLDTFPDTREFPLQSFDATPSHCALPDSSEEIRNAAAWARERLERNPEAQIGVIVPNLAQLRSKVERVFTAVLHPGLDADSAGRAFHLSLGSPLADAPVVRAALLTLELGTGELYLPRMGMLLRGPFLAGSDRERSQRALLDAGLRKRGAFRVGIRTVREHADQCPLLESALRKVERQFDQLPAVQNPSEWSRSFALILKAAGWPGDRPLASHEFQAIRAWNDALSRLATLDAVIEPISFAQALDKLGQIARDTLFQPEDEGARVQVMGLFESSGLRFDHLWVMGLHDQALPGPSHPNPFLPLELQRANSMPHSSAARELEVAATVMRRLLASAPELVFSYARQEGDQHLGPSPFVPAAAAEAAPWKAPTWQEGMRSSALLETLADSVAPPLPAAAIHAGGTWLLRDMAACHFRAWALNRAGARPLEEAEAGITSRDSGTAVHTALELIWTDLQTHGALCLLTPEQTRELVARHVRTGVAKTKGLGRVVEQIRLQKLLLEWMEIERRRPAFSVIELEAKHEARWGGIQITIKCDRVDQLDDGRRVILDYKTGVLKTGAWWGDRPDEPQVPLYCASQDQPVAAAAFAQIRCGDVGFKGAADLPSPLPQMKDMDVLKGAPLSRQIGEWRRIFERLAEEFRAGNAQVNPKQHACDYCAITALCRVQDGCD